MMNIYPQPSAPPLEPELQFQYITYPQHIANPQYITPIPRYMQSNYNQNYHNNIVSSKQNDNNCFTYIATFVGFFCCCFVVDETRV